MSTKSSVVPPSKKLEKFVIATAANVSNAANMVVWTAWPAIKAERMTTSPVIEPSAIPATVSRIGSLFRRRFRHSLLSLFPLSVS
ncbi:hypothetical protein KEJ18_01460 [Candidatus Bathyarchaeota archaeon]|nr:hypothetical protein [Candidatus Bathyarchaeota archaeon]